MQRPYRVRRREDYKDLVIMKIGDFFYVQSSGFDMTSYKILKALLTNTIVMFQEFRMRECANLELPLLEKKRIDE